MKSLPSSQKKNSGKAAAWATTTHVAKCQLMLSNCCIVAAGSNSATLGKLGK